VFEKLCITNKVTLYKVSKETKIPYSTLSDWKNGKSVPKVDKLQKIADFLNVSVEFLLTGKEKEFEVYSAENAILLAKATKNKDATQNATQNNKSLQDFSCRLSFNKMGCD
jgi:transcriptional regulator with XRE-family HTH domain